jgi:hypothetical protein
MTPKPAHSTVARRVLHELLRTILFGSSLIALALVMCSPCACVIPIAPQFEDPPAAQNFAPVIRDTAPVNGLVVPTKTFRATILDPNPGDDLYVLWLADFPPFGPNSRLLSSTRYPHAPMATTPQVIETSITIDCFGSNLATNIPQHHIMVAVADREFLKPEDQTSLDLKYTSLPDGRPHAEAHWTINLLCQ